MRRYAAAMDGMETALIVAVPAAEPIVSRHRFELDANARLGIPAHVTVLAPFLPGSTLGTEQQARLRRVVASVRPFRFPPGSGGLVRNGGPMARGPRIRRPSAI